MSGRFSFSRKLEACGEWVEALREFGMTWQEVAEYFSEDAVLSVGSANRFSKEWYRLKKRGFALNKKKVRVYLDEILVSGSIPRGRFVVRESAESIARASVSPSVRSCAAGRTWLGWAGFRPVWMCGEAVGGARWVVGG